MNKKILLSVLPLICLFIVNVQSQEINWQTFEAAVEKNESENKLIFIDVYTDWCGWCKVMDKKTFTNAEVQSYMNDNFHNVKLDAEQKESIVFKDKTFEWVNQGRNGIHQLAYSLLKGQMSFPSFVVLDANYKRIKVLKGYQTPEQLMAQLKPLVEKYQKKS